VDRRAEPTSTRAAVAVRLDGRLAAADLDLHGAARTTALMRCIGHRWAPFRGRVCQMRNQAPAGPGLTHAADTRGSGVGSMATSFVEAWSASTCAARPAAMPVAPAGGSVRNAGCL